MIILYFHTITEKIMMLFNLYINIKSLLHIIYKPFKPSRYHKLLVYSPKILSKNTFNS